MNNLFSSDLPLGSLDPGAAYIAVGETGYIRDAEAFIAERRYRQSLMAAQLLRLYKVQEVEVEITHLQRITAAAVVTSC